MECRNKLFRQGLPSVSRHSHLFQCDIIHGLQVGICHSVNLHGLQTGCKRISALTHLPCPPLMSGVCIVVSLTSSYFPLLHLTPLTYVFPESLPWPLIGLALARGGSDLELGKLLEPLTETTLAALPLLPSSLHTKPIQWFISTMLAVKRSYGRFLKPYWLPNGCITCHLLMHALVQKSTEIVL